MVERPASLPVRLAMVGVGSHMREHLFPALLELPAVRVVAVASQRPETAQRFAAGYDIERHHVGFPSALHDVDGVVVAGPPTLHEAVLKAGLHARIPVFVEKPPATDLASLRALVESEDQRQGLVFVDYNFRFAELVQKLFQAIAEPRYLRLRFIANKPRSPLWGLPTVEASYLYAVAIHALETALWRFGRVADMVTRYRSLGEHRFAAHVNLDFESGATVLLELGNYSNRFDCRWELCGADGSMAVVDNLDRIHYVPAESEKQAHVLGPKATVELASSGLRGGQTRGGYSQALAAFVHCIRTRQPSPSPLASSVPVYQLIESILASWHCAPSDRASSDR